MSVMGGTEYLRLQVLELVSVTFRIYACVLLDNSDLFGIFDDALKPEYLFVVALLGFVF